MLMPVSVIAEAGMGSTDRPFFLGLGFVASALDAVVALTVPGLGAMATNPGVSGSGSFLISTSFLTCAGGVTCGVDTGGCSDFASGMVGIGV